ncbi:unnamed protein product [Ilex paraguariensis]|uniref:Uncharacterized protein n=1 Tax=Ilex paraguariensis TaxID=185542 RepID=A0ABC8TDV9_9AQUA
MNPQLSSSLLLLDGVIMQNVKGAINSLAADLNCIGGDANCQKQKQSNVEAGTWSQVANHNKEKAVIETTIIDMPIVEIVPTKVPFTPQIAECSTPKTPPTSAHLANETLDTTQLVDNLVTFINTIASPFTDCNALFPSSNKFLG